MRSAMALVVSVLFILLVDLPSVAQRTNTLRGSVKVAADGGSTAVVRIQLQTFGMTIQEVFLHDNRFEFLNVGEGHYALVADSPGYETALQEVDVPGVWPVIELRPRRNPVQRAEIVPVWDLRIPKSARRQFDAAKSKLMENDCADALEHLKKAVDTYAEYGDAHKAIGECYAQMNELESAEHEFKLALEQPHAPELHLLLAKIYERAVNAGLRARQLELYAEEKPKQHGK